MKTKNIDITSFKYQLRPKKINLEIKRYQIKCVVFRLRQNQ